MVVLGGSAFSSSKKSPLMHFFFLFLLSIKCQTSHIQSFISPLYGFTDHRMRDYLILVLLLCISNQSYVLFCFLSKGVECLKSM